MPLTKKCRLLSRAPHDVHAGLLLLPFLLPLPLPLPSLSPPSSPRPSLAWEPGGAHAGRPGARAPVSVGSFSSELAPSSSSSLPPSSRAPSSAAGPDPPLGRHRPHRLGPRRPLPPGFSLEVLSVSEASSSCSQRGVKEGSKRGQRGVKEGSRGEHRSQRGCEWNNRGGVCMRSSHWS